VVIRVIGIVVVTTVIVAGIASATSCPSRLVRPGKHVVGKHIVALVVHFRDASGSKSSLRTSVERADSGTPPFGRASCASGQVRNSQHGVIPQAASLDIGILLVLREPIGEIRQARGHGAVAALPSFARIRNAAICAASPDRQDSYWCRRAAAGNPQFLHLLIYRK